MPTAALSALAGGALWAAAAAEGPHMPELLLADGVDNSPAPPLPALDIDPEGITISGISSGADFVVNLHVAHSSVIRGVGVFAGQAYHCSVTRFPKVCRPPSPTAPPPPRTPLPPALPK